MVDEIDEKISKIRENHAGLDSRVITVEETIGQIQIDIGQIKDTGQSQHKETLIALGDIKVAIASKPCPESDRIDTAETEIKLLSANNNKFLGGKGVLLWVISVILIVAGIIVGSIGIMRRLDDTPVKVNTNFSGETGKGETK